MQDATITQETQPMGTPMLVTADDLKHEIGEWVVASLNKDKIIERIATQIQVLNATIAQQKAAVDAGAAAIKSNELFSGKNSNLANDLRDVRAELVKVNGENVAIGKAAEAKDKLYEKVASKVESLTSDVTALTDDLKAMQDDLKAARDEHAVAIGDRDLEIEKLNAKHDRLLKTRAKKA